MAVARAARYKAAMSSERVHLPVLGGPASPPAGAPLADTASPASPAPGTDTPDGAPRRRRHPEWIRVPLPTKPTFFEV